MAIQFLIFSVCRLTGTLPEAYGKLHALNTLSLLGNNYTVRLPNQDAPVSLWTERDK